MNYEDNTIQNLLELDGERFLLDEKLGLWVKFEVLKVTPSQKRPHGIKYSLSLHDRKNSRIMGFDNAHSVDGNHTYDHWHRSNNDSGRIYHYQNAAKLLTDFWEEVDKILNFLRVTND